MAKLKVIEKHEETSTETEAKQAITRLRELGGEIQDIHRRELNCRMDMGRILLEVRDRDLYLHMPGRPKTWSEWLHDEVQGFYHITGLKARAAQEAIEFVESPTLARLPEPERGKIKTMSNARTLVKLERAGVEITPQHVAQAQSQPSAEFKRAVGVSEGGVVRAWVRDSKAVPHLQFVIDYLACLSASGALKLRQTIESIWKVQARGPEDCVDLIAGLVEAEIESEKLHAAIERQEFSQEEEWPESPNPITSAS